MFKKHVYNFFSALLILLQRTDIQKSNSIIRKNFNRLTKNKFNIINVLFQSLSYNKVFYAYENEIVNESNLLCKLILEEFPAKNLTILDIGCGIGGYHKKWIGERSNSSILYLMDNSEFNIRALSYGYGNSDRYYNSLFLTKFFLSNDGSSKVKIESIEIKKEYPDKIPNHLDLIISFISWGFHYSLEDYWSTIIQKMNQTSIILIDVRKNSQSYIFLKEQNNFSLEIISSNSKSDRVLVRKGV
jgi:SAM-dependent methyltransferase